MFYDMDTKVKAFIRDVIFFRTCSFEKKDPEGILGWGGGGMFRGFMLSLYMYIL